SIKIVFIYIFQIYKSIPNYKPKDLFNHVDLSLFEFQIYFRIKLKKRTTLNLVTYDTLVGI
ncbi:hypothetical protein ACK4RH_19095, partial [Proteus mirabilis]|uniref:hypothetical protein n=1 Tax=Proteus mirabilis TaxID=584 RepID=UPI0039198293